jgi:hypothetical protein
VLTLGFLGSSVEAIHDAVVRVRPEARHAEVRFRRRLSLQAIEISSTGDVAMDAAAGEPFW